MTQNFEHSRRRWRTIFQVEYFMYYLSAKKYLPHSVWVFYLAIVYRYYCAVGTADEPWRMGDWLIHYGGGPVRRGLIGTLLFSLSYAGVSLRWSTYAIQILFYGLIYYFVLKIYTSRERDWRWVVFLLSPAFLLFPFYDPAGGFRKEILVFASFAFFCCCYARKQMNNTDLLAGTTMFALAAFSHELTSFTVLFFIYLFHASYRKKLLCKKIAVSLVLIFSFLSITALVFAAYFKGDQATSTEICTSLLTQGLSQSICDGAISWLDKDWRYPFTYNHINRVDYAKFYAFALFIAVAPIFFLSPLKRDLKIIAVTGCLSILPLCLVAIDWGRWIHIYIFFIFCLILAESAQEEIRLEPIPAIIIIGYLVSWRIVHAGGYSLVGGFARNCFAWTSKIVAMVFAQ